MATIGIEGAAVVVALTPFEKAEALHGDLHIPLADIESVVALDRPLDALHGIRVGTHIPGITAVGTWIARDGSTFIVEHRRARGVSLALSRGTYRHVVVGCDDADAVALSITTALGATNPQP